MSSTKLAMESDVFITNMKMGVPEKLESDPRY